MSIAPPEAVTLHHHFASQLPELAAPWNAQRWEQPRLVVLNGPLAAELGLDADALRSDEGVQFLLGGRLPADAAPVAQAYAGHQFGHLSPRLGDGRALLLGEVVDTAGRLRDVHLKGSGRTPFSRGGDGLAALGPMLREHVISEAMHALGIPTTRSLAVVATGTPVLRETALPGAVLTRVASSHLRVGTFVYARGTGDLGLLRRLADFAIARHHPAAAGAEQPYLALLDEVIGAQASLVAKWMLVGFVHGVMNTDNMTISGETIDYGPCAFMDAYDAAAVYSSIDTGGRYAYGNQPGIAEWNLARLAEALLPLIDEDPDRGVEAATEVLHRFRPRYAAAWSAGMRAKLGLPAALDGATADALAADLLSLLEAGRVDHTSAFRVLVATARGDGVHLRDVVADQAAADGWERRWQAAGPDAEVMQQVNPVVIPRNHLVEEALAAAVAGDLQPLDALLEAVTDPCATRWEGTRYAEGAPGDGRYTTYCGT